MESNIIVLLVLFFLAKQTEAGYQWTSWSRPSSCSATCGHGIISRTRECKPTDDDIDDGTNESYCKGPATIEESCFLLPCHSIGFPSSTCNCGCKLTKSSGTISSIHKPNNVVTCIWFIETKPGSAITLRINRADHFDWTNGAIYVAGQQKFHKFSSQFGSRMSNSLPIVIKSTSNQLNVTLHHNKAAENNMQPFVVEASYTADLLPTSSSKNKSNKEISQNIPAMAGIAACGLIILIAAVVVVCRRIHRRNENKDDMDCPEEGYEDNCSSISGSQRSTKIKQPVHMNLMTGQGYPTSPTSSAGYHGEERANLLQPSYPTGTLSSRGYSEANDMFVEGVPTTGTYIPGQPYNWPVQSTQIQQPLQIQQLPKAAIDFMINQAQLNFARQMTLDQSKITSSYYPTSEGEG